MPWVSPGDMAAFEQVMAEMAADPDIRRENAALAREFAPAGNDGLGGAQAVGPWRASAGRLAEQN